MPSSKPIRVFYSLMTGRFYATAHYKVGPRGFVVVTGKKYDVTNDIAASVIEHDIEFAKVEDARPAAQREPTADDGALREALNQAAEWLEAYGMSHLSKGDQDKADRNFGRAAYCRRAARAPEHEGEGGLVQAPVVLVHLAIDGTERWSLPLAVCSGTAFDPDYNETPPGVRLQLCEACRAAALHTSSTEEEGSA